MSYPETQDDVAELLLCHSARGAEHRHIGDGHHKGPGNGHTDQLDDLGGTVEGQPELQRSAQDCGHCHIAECQGQRGQQLRVGGLWNTSQQQCCEERGDTECRPVANAKDQQQGECEATSRIPGGNGEGARHIGSCKPG